MGPCVSLIFSLFSLPHQLSSTRRSPSSLLVLALPTGGGGSGAWAPRRGSGAEVCFGRWRRPMRRKPREASGRRWRRWSEGRAAAEEAQRGPGAACGGRQRRRSCGPGVCVRRRAGAGWAAAPDVLCLFKCSTALCPFVC
ncbi:hypothetical protein PVAP13_4KG361210 [Panicum virgatum]|uniref:Uncharacterized protein n=1 Tax=Panicum virgatum TaxID=38727 RepID=A0A8T0TRM0_PANVG|nr:hypothetical protein PVAP13_4KG361210 [Panicum virgatum]